MSSRTSPPLAQAGTPVFFTVRDAAERLQVTPRTLKYYEELGLVVPTRSEGRYRLYTESDVDRFGRIMRLRSLGFSFPSIAELLKRPVEQLGDGRTGYSTESLEQLKAALEQQVSSLDARISAVVNELKEAQTTRDELNDDLTYVRRRLAGESRDALVGERLAARKRRPGAATRAPREPTSR